MEFKFTPEYKVINDLFAREVRYVIPEYQRPYSWGCEGKSDKNNQVNNMWDDLYGYFVSEKKESYFLGSMVLIGNGDRVYQVVDGQQRLTTIVLLFAAIKCFMLEVAKEISGAELRRVAERMVRFNNNLILARPAWNTSSRKHRSREQTGPRTLAGSFWGSSLTSSAT